MKPACFLWDRPQAHVLPHNLNGMHFAPACSKFDYGTPRVFIQHSARVHERNRLPPSTYLSLVCWVQKQDSRATFISLDTNGDKLLSKDEVRMLLDNHIWGWVGLICSPSQINISFGKTQHLEGLVSKKNIPFKLERRGSFIK